MLHDKDFGLDGLAPLGGALEEAVHVGYELGQVRSALLRCVQVAERHDYRDARTVTRALGPGHGRSGGGGGWWCGGAPAALAATQQLLQAVL